MPLIPYAILITKQQLKQEKYEASYAAAGPFKKGFLKNVRFRRFGKMLENEKNALAEKNRSLEAEVASLKKHIAAEEKFSTMIAHDLRSPFNSILGFSQILATEINEMPIAEAAQYANNLNDAAKNVFRFLDNLLQWGRLRTGSLRPEPVNHDLLDVIEDKVVLLGHEAQKKGIALKLDMPPSKTRAHADKDMASVIVHNLLSNAIKFTPQGGMITTSTFDAGKGFVGIAIADTGVGIPKSQLESIFQIDANYKSKGTAKETGTGLGLKMIKEMVEKNGGRVWAESEVGKGTTFHFTLPAAKEEPAKPT